MVKFQRPTKKSIIEYALLAVIIIAMIFMVAGFGKRGTAVSLYETSTSRYIRGTVTEIISEDLSYAEKEYLTGYQSVRVNLGDGEEVVIDNYITATHNVVLREGSSVVVYADMPEGIEAYYSIYNYDRSFGIFAVSAAFLLLVILVGRKKGFMSCVGLLFTVCTVVCILLPELFEGSNAAPTAVIAVIVSTAVSCFCISGLSKKTLFNIASTVLGTVSAGLIYRAFMFILNLSGTAMSEAESLILISRSTGLELNGILFAGVLVSSLGAVMDVAVSMGASLHEIKELNPDISPKELFRSGMNIGRDMIGTMTNTLILAFTGGTLATLIVFMSYGIQFNQLLSSNFLALEVATGIAGSSAVVLTVPISAAVFSNFSFDSKK